MKLIIAMIMLAILAACSEGTTKPQFEYKESQGNGVVAKFGDIKITDGDLKLKIASDVYDAEKKVFELKFNQIKALIIEKLIEQDPDKKAMTTEEYIEKNIVSKIKISDKQINAFIKERKIPKEHINPQIKERIEGFLKNQEKLKAVDAWLAKKTKSKAIEVFIPQPKRPSFEIKVGKAPSLGPKDAKVTIIEFSDFQCPFCAKGADVLHALKKKYGKKVQIAFKNFPLDFHKQAEMAAIGSFCAQEQSVDKFWKMHDSMFKDQTKLAVDDLKKLAKSIGLDSKKFDACLDSKKYLEQVKADIKEGQSIGVKSTPTFFINGMIVNGAQPIEVFSEIIDQEL